MSGEQLVREKVPRDGIEASTRGFPIAVTCDERAAREETEEAAVALSHVGNVL